MEASHTDKGLVPASVPMRKEGAGIAGKLRFLVRLGIALLSIGVALAIYNDQPPFFWLFALYLGEDGTWQPVLLSDTVIGAGLAAAALVLFRPLAAAALWLVAVPTAVYAASPPAEDAVSWPDMWLAVTVYSAAALGAVAASGAFHVRAREPEPHPAHPDQLSCPDCGHSLEPGEWASGVFPHCHAFVAMPEAPSSMSGKVRGLVPDRRAIAVRALIGAISLIPPLVAQLHFAFALIYFAPLRPYDGYFRYLPLAEVSPFSLIVNLAACVLVTGVLLAPVSVLLWPKTAAVIWWFAAAGAFWLGTLAWDQGVLWAVLYVAIGAGAWRSGRTAERSELA